MWNHKFFTLEMVGKSTNPQNEASAMERITNGSCRRLRTNLQAILSRTNIATRPIIKIAGISWIGTATSTTATTSTLQQRRIGLLATITPSMHAVQKVTVAVAMAVAALSRPRPCSSKWGCELTYSTGTKTNIKDGSDRNDKSATTAPRPPATNNTKRRGRRATATMGSTIVEIPKRASKQARGYSHDSSASG